MAAPIQSKLRVACSSRLSGTWRQVAHAAMAMSGTLMKNAERQEIVSTSTPPTTGPRIVAAPEAPAHTPNARPCSSPEEFARRALEDPEQHQQLHVGSEAAQHRRGPEPEESEQERSLAAVEVVDGARQDEQRTERQQVSVVDVRLALQDAEEKTREVAADLRQGDVDNRRVEKDDPRSEHGSDENPALGAHAISEIAPAEKVFQHKRPRCLVQRDAVAAREHERRARSHRNLELSLPLQASLLQGGSCLFHVVDTVDVDGSFVLEVIGEQHVWRAIGQLDQRHASAHALDREPQLATEHFREVLRVRGDVVAGRVQVVELKEFRLVRIVDGCGCAPGTSCSASACRRCWMRFARNLTSATS